MRSFLLVMSIFTASFYGFQLTRNTDDPDCLKCRVRAYNNGKLLRTEDGAPLLFRTQEDADRYAREYAQP